jgi:hypothetical protein
MYYIKSYKYFLFFNNNKYNILDSSSDKIYLTIHENNYFLKWWNQINSNYILSIINKTYFDLNIKSDMNENKFNNCLYLLDSISNDFSVINKDYKFKKAIITNKLNSDISEYLFSFLNDTPKIIRKDKNQNFYKSLIISIFQVFLIILFIIPNLFLLINIATFKFIIRMFLIEMQ